jgi:hypothetical protein
MGKAECPEKTTYLPQVVLYDTYYVKNEIARSKNMNQKSEDF